MEESRKENVKQKFKPKIFLSCLTSGELDILYTMKKGSSENEFIKHYVRDGGRKKSRKSKKRKSKKRKSKKKI